MYTHLAHLYDWPGSVDFADAVLAKTLAHFVTEGLQPPAGVLDLACGTGAVTVALAQAGYTVTGLDCSAAMVGEAQHRAKQAGLENNAITWQIADMRTFALAKPVSAVTCFSDSLNHLLSEVELSQALQAIYQALRPGGWLLFDLNTQENYHHLWQGEDTDTTETATLHFSARFDAACGRAETRITATTPANPQPVCDVVTEQFYDTPTVARLLGQAGFCHTTHEDFTPLDVLPHGLPLKTFWVCQKPA